VTTYQLRNESFKIVESHQVRNDDYFIQIRDESFKFVTNYQVRNDSFKFVESIEFVTSPSNLSRIIRPICTIIEKKIVQFLRKKAPFLLRSCRAVQKWSVFINNIPRISHVQHGKCVIVIMLVVQKNKIVVSKTRLWYQKQHIYFLGQRCSC